MMLKKLLRRDIRGIGAVEFALVAPVLVAFVIGVAQMGKLFFANADMKNALASGARAASIWPVPEDPAILAAVNDRLARSSGVSKATVTIERDTDDNGNQFVEISMRYQVPLDFIFFDAGPIALEDSRKVFIQMDGTAPENDNGGGTTSASTTSTTSGGDTGTTSSTSGGDTGTSSSTSSGDTGTSTSSTSTTSAGGTSSGTTSSTSTTSASSSGNGNSNGNSSHGHGNCNKKC